MKKVITRITIGLAIVFILLGFVSPIIIKNFIVIEGLKLDEITTWITGCMSSCFSLSSICLVIVTLNINGENEQKNQFQNRFFKWYEIFESVKQKIGNSYLTDVVVKLDDELKTIDYEVVDSGTLKDIIYDTEKVYKKVLDEEKYHLGEYISCLYNLMKFIDEEAIEQKEKEFCVSFLRANLSISEKKIIFYHSFSDVDGKKFHNIVEKYKLLSGIEDKHLIEGKNLIYLYGVKIYR